MNDYDYDYNEVPEWVNHICIDEYGEGFDEVDWSSMSLEEIEEFEEEHGIEMSFEDEVEYIQHCVEVHGFIPTGSLDGYYD